MAYVTTNQPDLMVGNHTTKIWAYKSADVVATVRGAGYFTNGGKGINPNLGMKVGDLLLVQDTATPLATLCYVSAVSAAGAVTVV